MNILTIDGDRYILSLPTPDIMEDLRKDLFDRGYRMWNPCVVKERNYVPALDKVGSITWVEGMPLSSWGIATGKAQLHKFCVTTPLLFFRPMLIPINQKGQKEAPLNPDWMETEGGSVKINGKLINFNETDLSEFWLNENNGQMMVRSLSICGSRGIQNNIKWVWMHGCMVAVNLEVPVPIEFIRKAKFLH